MTVDVLTEVDGPIARITFNRPAARNAITQEMLLTMRAFLHRIEHDADVRCIVLSGVGDHFSAGGDVIGFGETLKIPAKERRAAFEGRIQNAAPVFLQFARAAVPVVAKVRGAVAGAALGFALGADFVICGSGAVFILAHVHIGASPDGSSSYYLPRLIGERKAKELAILGQRVSADEALGMGMINQVVPDTELDSAVDSLLQKIVAAPATSVRRAKLLMGRSLGNSLEQQLQLEAESFAECAATDDFVEGVTAFAEKRKAIFNRKS